jgi:uncharacterized protein (DUF58 family)
MAALLSDDILQTIARWRIIARQAPRGGPHAEHRSRDLGGGIEFRDYRAYAPGDDLRRVDWNIYRRSRRLFLRLYEEPRSYPVYVLLDVSDSMFFENPPRADAAKLVAAVFAAIALNQHDATGVYPFGAGLRQPLAGLSNRLGLPRVAEFIEQQGPAGATDLVQSLGRFASMRQRLGLAVVISDFFDPRGIETVVEALRLVRHQLAIVQLARAGDAEPNLDGELALTDCESGATVEVTVTPGARTRYRQAHEKFETRLREFAALRRAAHVRLDVDAPILGQLDCLFRDGIFVT